MSRKVGDGMRQILFKAKRVDNGEWIEGYYFYNPNIDKHFVHNWLSGGLVEVDSDTICQYTELTDKNGNKIWENDVVDIKHYAENAHEVKWGYGGFHVGINGLLCHYNTVCEVIGNVFDNADLLKGE